MATRTVSWINHRFTRVTTERSGPTFQRPHGLALLAAGLEILVGVGAVFGGGLLVLAPDGHLLGMTTKILGSTPFPSFLIPGIILFSAIGLLPLAAAAITLRRHPIAPLLAVLVGITLIGWITVEMVALAGAGSLAWALYLVLGTLIASLGLTRLRTAS